MAEDLPDYDERRHIHQSAFTSQFPRGGCNTRLVAQTMATAAGAEYHSDTDVPEVKSSSVPARCSPSTLLDVDEVRNMHVMVEGFLDPCPDGYASYLSGLRRPFRDFLAASSIGSAAPISDGAGPIH